MHRMEKMEINIALKHYISFSRSFTIFHCRALKQVLILSLPPNNLSGLPYFYYSFYEISNYSVWELCNDIYSF